MLLLLYWVYSLDGLTNDSVETFLGSGLAEVQRFGEASGLEEVLDAIADTISASVSVLEGYMCVSYTTCCRGTADRTCVRRDASTDAGHVVAGDMQDPSAPLFCSYVTGAGEGYFRGPDLNWVKGLVTRSNDAVCVARWGGGV